MSDSSFIFERQYQILVGVKSGSSFDIVAVIEPEHHIELSVREEIPNEGSSLSPCEINLYNIGRENIQAFSRKGLTVVVKAGYRYDQGLTNVPDSGSVVYEGDIIDVYHQNTGVDVVSTLVCQEGHHSAIQAVLSKPITFDAGYSILDAFKDVLEKTPYTYHINFEGKDELKFKKGYTAQGQIIKVLDEMCRKFSAALNAKVNPPKKGQPSVTVSKTRLITWMFHRGQILVLNRRPLASETGVWSHNIPRSRIKDIIDIGYDEKVATAQTNNTGIKQIEIKTFLLPEVSIGDNIVIESLGSTYYDNPELSGNTEFAVIGIQTELQYDGGKWDTIITGRVRE